MSGIAGIVHTGNDRFPEQSHAIERMLKALAVRGPDAQAAWEEGPVSLGLAVFRTTPEQVREVGPLQFAHVVVVADARLDEREALLDALEVPRREHGSISDGELIARAYLRWGRACLDHLAGDFAFALWDCQSHSLFCARDLFAVRPFYYAVLPRGLVFSTTFEPFRASGLVSMAADPVRVYDALTYKFLEFGEPERSFFQELRRLPAGHTLVYANGHLQVRRYALLKPATQPLPKDPRELPLLFRAHFKRAVDRRLRSTGPLTSMLSGGLDSGAIVCMARELLRERGEGPLITCSALSDPPWDQETAYVRAVQRGGGLECHDLTMVRMPEFAPDMIAYLEQTECTPLDWVCSHMWLACAVTARRAGSRIMLTGEPGDYAIGIACNPTQRALREGALWDAFALPLHMVVTSKWPRSELYGEWRGGLGTYLQQDVLRWLSPAFYWSRRRGRHRVVRERYHRSCLRPLSDPLADEMLARFSRMRTVAEWPAQQHEDHWLAHGVDRMLGGVSEVWDRVCSAQGIEARHPLLDRELVEFCMAVPWRARMADGRTKTLLRQSGILPPEHVTQTGMGNANSAARYAMCMPAADSWMGRWLERGGADAWFSPAHIQDLRTRWNAGPRDDVLTDQVLEVNAVSLWAARGAS